MSPETVRVAADRIAAHAQAHRLADVYVVVHGGEPLLMGPRPLASALTELRDRIGRVATLHLRLQSNGVLLTEQLCEILRDHDVHIGISLDGDRQANDRHRLFANGASSYDKTLDALRLLRRPEFRAIYAGILCTVDVDNDPIAVYETLVAQEPPRIDFLLPHANWDRPPRQPDGDRSPYGTWLSTIFRRWVADGRTVPIRLFDSLQSAGIGGPSTTETVGLDPADLAVIETDGEWEQADSIKTAFDGAPTTGLNIFDHSVDEVVQHPAIAQRQRPLEGLCPTCRACPVVTQCGGGLFAHRYRSTNGFDNPSVYCGDLIALIGVINAQPARPRQADHMSAHEPGVPTSILDQIGSGFGDAEAIGYLNKSELAIRRALVIAAARRAGGLGQAWAMFTELDRISPTAVAEVLLHPYFRVWAVGYLEPKAVRSARPDIDDGGYLANLAAAAAARAGVDAGIQVPVRDGIVFLPTLGSAVLPTSVDALAEVRTGPAGWTVRSASGDEVRVRPDRTGEEPPGWLPAHRVGTDGFTVALEDGDPYRACHDWAPTPRLDDAAVDAWQWSFDRAWRAIERDVPGHGAAMRTALRVITPVQADDAGLLRASTARQAYGAVAAAYTDDGEALATMLVHEWQHAKLGALMDLCDLFDADDRRRLPVGWRTDPRPIEGVLQGVYAHLAVADVWRRRAARDDRGAPAAAFRQYRRWTGDAIDLLRASGTLTPAGLRLVERMATTMDRWPSG
jgi:uncharacterized protein